MTEELYRMSPFLRQMRQRQGLSLEDAVYEAMRLTDKTFYTEGVYLSPENV